MASGSDEKELQLLSTMNTLYSTNREDVRRKLLDELIILLFRQAYDPTRFIAAGGIVLLIRATGDRSEVIRHHAVHGLVRLIELGCAGRVMDAGAISAFHQLGNDPYRPVRETAQKALGLLDKHWRRESVS